jgi:hypothetical protein
MAKQQQIFSDILCLNITPEMRARLNRFIAERCGRYAQTAPVVRDLLDTMLAYYGYPSPETQQPQAPFPAAPSPFAINGAPPHVRG